MRTGPCLARGVSSCMASVACQGEITHSGVKIVMSIVCDIVSLSMTLTRPCTDSPVTTGIASMVPEKHHITESESVDSVRFASLPPESLCLNAQPQVKETGNQIPMPTCNVMLLYTKCNRPVCIMQSSCLMRALSSSLFPSHKTRRNSCSEDTTIRRHLQHHTSFLATRATHQLIQV